MLVTLKSDQRKGAVIPGIDGPGQVLQQGTAGVADGTIALMRGNLEEHLM